MNLFKLSIVKRSLFKFRLFLWIRYSFSLHFGRIILRRIDCFVFIENVKPRGSLGFFCEGIECKWFQGWRGIPTFGRHVNLRFEPFIFQSVNSKRLLLWRELRTRYFEMRAWVRHFFRVLLVRFFHRRHELFNLRRLREHLLKVLMLNLRNEITRLCLLHHHLLLFIFKIIRLELHEPLASKIRPRNTLFLLLHFNGE